MPEASKLPSGPNVSVQQTAEGIVAAAVRHMKLTLGVDLVDGISAGMIGSYARGQLRATSDLDFYVIFNVRKPSPENHHIDPQRMSEIVCELSDYVRREYSHEPLAQRFSVFWTTRDCLVEGGFDVGRFPAYDRLALRQRALHLLGRELSGDDWDQVTKRDVIVESADFLLTIVREKVGSTLLTKLDQLDEQKLEGLGPVLPTKAITMPIRLLYVLESSGEEALIADTESAIFSCESHLGSQSWWPLIQEGLRLRETPPEDSKGWKRASDLMRAELGALYDFCLSAYVQELRHLHEEERAERLGQWQLELRSVAPPRPEPGARPHTSHLAS